VTIKPFRLNLAPGAAKTLRLKFRVPRDLGGASHLLVIVDSDDRFAEPDENNNLADALDAFAPAP
jgi:subtilase family serine protease